TVLCGSATASAHCQQRHQCCGRRGRGWQSPALPERNPEEDHDGRCEGGRDQPEALPLPGQECFGTTEEAVVESTGELCADQHPDAVRDEHEEPLGLTAHGCCRLLVDVDLAGHEEEVIADAVEQDPCGNQAECTGRCGDGEEDVAQHPCGHPRDEHPLHAQPHEEERHEQHEEDFGHLTE